MKRDKVRGIDLKTKRPITQKIATYDESNTTVYLKTQSNRAMTRDYKAEIVMERDGRWMSAIIDRDELIMALRIE